MLGGLPSPIQTQVRRFTHRSATRGRTGLPPRGASPTLPGMRLLPGSLLASIVVLLACAAAAQAQQRYAAPAGEGAVCVRLVHEYLDTHDE